MEKRFIFEIKKGGKIIANKFCCYELTDLDVLPMALLWTKDILFNYNKNLAGSDLIDMLLAIRMLQKENVEGTLEPGIAALMDTSELHVITNHTDFDLYGADPDANEVDEIYGLIAVLDSDIEANRRKHNIQIIIDLDNLTACFNFRFTRLSRERWEEITERDFSELKICSYDFSCIPFNQLEDVHTFAGQNNGWVTTESIWEENPVIMPF